MLLEVRSKPGRNKHLVKPDLNPDQAGYAFLAVDMEPTGTDNVALHPCPRSTVLQPTAAIRLLKDAELPVQV